MFLRELFNLCFSICLVDRPNALQFILINGAVPVFARLLEADEAYSARAFSFRFFLADSDHCAQRYVPGSGLSQHCFLRS